MIDAGVDKPWWITSLAQYRLHTGPLPVHANAATSKQHVSFPAPNPFVDVNLCFLSVCSKTCLSLQRERVTLHPRGGQMLVITPGKETRREILSSPAYLTLSLGLLFGFFSASESVVLFLWSHEEADVSIRSRGKHWWGPLTFARVGSFSWERTQYYKPFPLHSYINIPTGIMNLWSASNKS